MCVHASVHSLKFMTVLRPLDLIKPIQARWQTGLVNAVLWNKERQTGRSQQQAALIKAPYSMESWHDEGDESERAANVPPS